MGCLVGHKKLAWPTTALSAGGRVPGRHAKGRLFGGDQVSATYPGRCPCTRQVLALPQSTRSPRRCFKPDGEPPVCPGPQIMALRRTRPLRIPVCHRGAFAMREVI